MNDIRQKENMNPIEDGDEYLVPTNMAPAGTLPIAPLNQPSDEETDARVAKEMGVLL